MFVHGGNPVGSRPAIRSLVSLRPAIYSMRCAVESVDPSSDRTIIQARTMSHKLRRVYSVPRATRWCMSQLERSNQSIGIESFATVVLTTTSAILPKMKITGEHFGAVVFYGQRLRRLLRLRDGLQIVHFLTVRCRFCCMKIRVFYTYILRRQHAGTFTKAAALKALVFHERHALDLQISKIVMNSHNCQSLE